MPEATPHPRDRRPFAPRALRALGLVLLVGTAGTWAYLGAHRGWSQNRVPSKQVDDITGIEYVTYEERFVPGLDWLGAGCVLAGTAFALSFLPRLHRNQNNHTT